MTGIPYGVFSQLNELMNPSIFESGAIISPPMILSILSYSSLAWARLLFG
jgi:hypothetical protein